MALAASFHDTDWRRIHANNYQHTYWRKVSSDGPNILVPTEIMHAVKSIINANSMILSTFYAVRGHSYSNQNSSNSVGGASATSDLTTSTTSCVLESILYHYNGSSSNGKNSHSLNHLLEVLRDSRVLSMSLYLSLSSQRKSCALYYIVVSI